MTGRTRAERCAGWCPGAGAIHADLTTGSTPENLLRRGDALPPRIITLALIFLLPVLPAALFTGYTLMLQVLLPSTGVQMAVKTLTVVFPAAILILYGRRTSDTVTSTLAGALLYPLFAVYSLVLAGLCIPGFLMTPITHWVQWGIIVSSSLFVLLFGAMGYCASRRTNGSFLIAVSLGALMIAIVLGIR